VSCWDLGSGTGGYLEFRKRNQMEGNGKWWKEMGNDGKKWGMMERNGRKETEKMDHYLIYILRWSLTWQFSKHDPISSATTRCQSIRGASLAERLAERIKKKKGRRFKEALDLPENNYQKTARPASWTNSHEGAKRLGEATTLSIHYQFSCIRK